MTVGHILAFNFLRLVVTTPLALDSVYLGPWDSDLEALVWVKVEAFFKLGFRDR